MSAFFKDKNRFTLALSALFLVVTLMAGSVAYFTGDLAIVAGPGKISAGDSKKGESADSIPVEDMDVDSSGDFEDLEDLYEPAYFNLPAEMRGTFLVPGSDFLKTKDSSTQTIRDEIDGALDNADKLTINAVIVDTVYNDQVIYQTKDAPELSSDFDILEYIIDSAQDKGFYTYAIFDASDYDQQQFTSMLAVGAGSANKLARNINEFATKYKLDGILIDGYQNSDANSSYISYLNAGGGIGFGNFLRQTPSSIVKTASQAIREAAPSTQVGLLADAVWENQSVNEAGSATQAAYTSLSSGNADTKGFIEKGYVDFVAVKAYTSIENQSEPFGEVVRWWADVARSRDIPMYVVHASNKIGSGETGWGSQDQLIKQLSEASEVPGFRGSIFNSLTPLTASSSNLGENLVKYYNNEVEPEQILTKLEMTRPTQTTFTTSDPYVIFSGASDPAEQVTINGQVIETDASGYFAAQAELVSGQNSFVVRHKDQSISYSITRKVEVLKDASPKSDVTVDGGMSVTISAVAYEEADVYASVNGERVSMTWSGALEHGTDREGAFRNFSGEYTVPAATGEVQNLGKIVVYASYDGQTASIECGNIRINKKAKVADGVAVRVVAEQAMTYPPSTSNNVPSALYYPLPQGAMDYVVGDPVTYTKDGKTYTYSVLASGLRVESKDITAISDDFPEGNSITGLSVSTGNGYTYVTLKTAQKVSYSVKYSSSGMSFSFHNTASVPSDMTLSQNPMFTQASWNDATLTLSFAKSGGFMGYKGYYDQSGNLVLRFNNPPSSLSGARIAIDPGHGGKDQGAPGFLADYPESVLTKLISQYLASELEARGATVYLMNNDNIEGQQRYEAAEKWGAHIFVSVHCNTAPNINATGTEVYYFQSFNQRLASNMSSAVSSALSTDNRGAKASYYHATLSSQFQSVLVECGFLSNRAEYEKLVTKKYQQSIAVGMADALSATIKGTYTGVSASGSESTGSAAAPGDPDVQDQSSSTSQLPLGDGSGVTAIFIDDFIIGVGKTITLQPEYHPDRESGPVTWKSSNTRIATVDKNGKVTGVREGEATITATLDYDKKIVGSCTVTVATSTNDTSSTNTADSGIRLSEAFDAFFDYSEVVLNPGNSMRLEIISDTGEVILGGDFEWDSDDTSIATVDSKGYVTAKKNGESLITASGDGFDLECYVVVTSTQIKMTGVSLNKSSLALVRNNTEQLTITFSPANATNKSVTWSSSNSNIATVNSSGLVTAKRAGTAVITVKTKDGNHTAKCTVTVTTKAVAVEEVVTDSLLELRVGDSDQIYYDVFPEDATNKSVVWTSSNPSVVSVDAEGKVKALKEGTATITCTSVEGKKYNSTCEVTVLK